MRLMRTTLTLDDDVAEKLRELARRWGQPLGIVVNAVLRRGLGSGGAAKTPEPFRAESFHGAFRPGIDPGRLNQLVDELDVQDRAERGR
jgi:hypothetical protein